MTAGRVLSTTLTTVVVAGCAVLVVGMARDGRHQAEPTARLASPTALADRPSIPAQLPLTEPAQGSGSGEPASSSTPAPTGRPVRTPSTAPSAPRTTTAPTTASHTTAPSTPAGAVRVPATTRPTSHPAVRANPRPAAKPVVKPAARVVRGTSLPVHYSTGSATRVITVTASSRSRTTATLQAWTKASGGGWLHYGSAVTAHIGAQGMSTAPSESRSATPMGSFTLTQAFGRNADPGTRLPYFKTRPSDWWISQPGSLYNTHQRCSSGCSFRQGSPNEHLYYETPYYNYAVVIDYNTRNTGHVRQGAGSAFFLHVTDGSPTAGCVAIPQSRLVALMRWLTPSAHPRILIGVS